MHHPNGDGEVLAPIATEYFRYSTFTFPTVEEALLGDFTKPNSKRKHKDVAALIFQNSCTLTLQMLPVWGSRIDSWQTLTEMYAICSGNMYTLDEYFSDAIQVTIGDDVDLPLKCEGMEFNTTNMILWMRINLSHALYKYYKRSVDARLQMFWNNHVPALQSGQLDKYVPCGRCPPEADQDRQYITVEQHRVPNLVTLEQLFPQHVWVLEELDELQLLIDVEALLEYYPVSDDEDNEFLLRCLFVMRQCEELYRQHPECVQLREYYACFADYFQEGTLKLSMRLYPTRNRAFTANDLPDVFHALFQIPLRGIKIEMDTDLVRYLQKCLPFASQSRKLTQAVVRSMQAMPAFNNLVCKLFWCAMSNMYNTPGVGWIDMDMLVRVDYLCHTPNLLLETLQKFKQKDLLCPILLLCFRLWVIYMLQGKNRWYMECTQSYVNWTAFVAATHEAHRRFLQLDFYAEDWLRPCGEEVKFPIHRYKDDTPAFCLTKIMLKIVQTQLYPKILAQANFAQPLRSFNRAKQNILNLLLHMPMEERYSPLAISLLQLDRCGGLEPLAIRRTLQLVLLFDGVLKPKDVKRMVREFTYREFHIVMWFFLAIGMLERIQLLPLPPSVTRTIDQRIMDTQFMLYPGQRLSPSVYNVYLTLCCGHVRSLDGSCEYGSEDVAYNVDRQQDECTHATKKSRVVISSKDLEKGSGFINEKHFKKRVRDACTDFCHIQCRQNPPLCINLRGFMLRYRTTKTTYNTYMHCHSCGCFHRYEHSNWTNAYYCRQCIPVKTGSINATCCMCGIELQQKVLEKSTLTVISSEPASDGDYIQRLYFCKKHRRAANSSARFNVDKGQLFTNAKNKVEQNMKQRAGMAFH